MSKKVNFLPARDGYHFANEFVNQVVAVSFIKFQTKGLCGGMVMTALDYWRSKVPIPTYTSSDFGAQRVPGGKLYEYILERQIHSLTTKAMATRWIVAPWNNFPERFHDWATKDEFEVIKQQINMGRPAMLGLWSMKSGDVLGGHQVLCYGYDTNPSPRLFIYDPNHPNQEVVLIPDSPAKGCILEIGGIPIIRKDGTNEAYRGYFFTDVYNWDENPPYQPKYKQLIMSI